MKVDCQKFLNIKTLSVLSAAMAGSFILVNSAAADFFSDNFDSFSNWNSNGSVQTETFYCRSGNCVKLSNTTRDPVNGVLTKEFSVEEGATYKVRVYGTVHNGAGLPTSDLGASELIIDYGNGPFGVSCSSNCAGGDTPNYQELSIERQATSNHLTVYLKGWEGKCNDKGCSDPYIDDFSIDKIANKPEENTSASQTIATPTPTPTPTTTVTPTPLPPSVATPTITPTLVSTARVNVITSGVTCPAGFTGTMSGSTLVCVQQIQTQTQIASGGSASATATGGSVNVTLTSNSVPTITPTPTTAPSQSKAEVLGTTSLPKTGLPLMAWSLSGLLPLGLGMKRLDKNTIVSQNFGNFIWQKREYLKDNFQA